MKEVLRLNEISPLVNSVFQDKYIMTKDAKEPVGILVRSFNMHEYKLAPSVLCVGRAGAGTNNIPLDRYAEEGVVVSILREQTRTPSRSWCCQICLCAADALRKALPGQTV